ncbi:hypothetical protein D9M71_842910 [compost metagenome]
MTAPCTTISPRPNDEVTNTTSRKPDSVSRVNSTPDEPTPERTISCTPADRNTSSCLKP